MFLDNSVVVIVVFFLCEFAGCLILHKPMNFLRYQTSNTVVTIHLLEHLSSINAGMYAKDQSKDNSRIDFLCLYLLV